MRRALPALASASALALAGCAGGASGADRTPEDLTLTVFAAASLAESFEVVGEQFEQDHPGVQVRLNVAGSSSLAEQIRAGAPADVFAAADGATMDRAVDADAVAGEPRPFATNVLALVTPPDNPAGVGSLEDAAAEGVNLVVCAPQVPCGHAAVTLAEDAGVALAPVSEESSVTDVLGKVTSGEADAGLVYATDAAGTGDAVHTVALGDAGTAVNTYPIAALKESEHAELAEAFVEHVLGPRGRQVLRDDGFGAP